MGHTGLKLWACLITLAAVLCGRDCASAEPGVTYQNPETGQMVVVTDPNEKLDGGITHLMRAAGAGDCKAAGELIGLGADVMAQSDNGTTPLWKAAQSGCVEVCRTMLDKGADPNAANDKGETPFMVAVVNKRADIINIMVDHGADVLTVTDAGATALFFATLNDDMDTVRMILGRIKANGEANRMTGADAAGFLKDYVNRSEANGWTALMNAAWNGNLELIRILLDAGADINKSDIRGNTAQGMASRNNKPEAEKLLLDAGAK